MLVAVTAVAGAAVVGIEFTPPGLLQVGCISSEEMNNSSAVRSKSAPALMGLGILMAVCRTLAVTLTGTHNPFTMVIDVSEYAVNTSYAVGDVLKL